MVSHEKLGVHAVQFDRPDEIKFCENETNVAVLFGRQESGHLYKDGLHDYVVRGRQDAVDSSRGTKAAGIYRRAVAAGASTTIRVRLSAGTAKPAPFADFDQTFSLRKSEADAFYAELQSAVAGRGSSPHPAPGFRRRAVVEAVFLLRRHRVAGR